MNAAWEWATAHVELVTGVAFGVLGVAIGVYYGRQAQQPKTLDWRLNADEVILSRRADALRSRLSVEWNGKQVQNPRLLSIRIINSGKKEITSAHYVEPLSITIPECQPLEFSISDASDPSLTKLEALNAASKLAGEDTIQLQPRLLNPKEWVDLQIIVDGTGSAPQVTSRIEGQSRRMMNLDDLERQRSLAFRETSQLTVMALLVFILAEFILASTQSPVSPALALWLSAALTTLFVLGALLLPKARQRLKRPPSRSRRLT